MRLSPAPRPLRCACPPPPCNPPPHAISHGYPLALPSRPTRLQPRKAPAPQGSSPERLQPHKAPVHTRADFDVTQFQTGHAHGVTEAVGLAQASSPSRPEARLQRLGPADSSTLGGAKAAGSSRPSPAAAPPARPRPRSRGSTHTDEMMRWGMTSMGERMRGRIHVTHAHSLLLHHAPIVVTF